VAARGPAGRHRTHRAGSTSGMCATCSPSSTTRRGP
jgi:hypothetical protein